MYSPSNQWAYGTTCTTCSIHPETPGQDFGAVVDVSQVHNGSWHDTTYHPNLHTPTVTVTFIGQAVYVYTIIANTIINVTTLTSLVFTLDGEVVGHFKHHPDKSAPVLMYNVPVYINSSIPYGNHTLEISTEGATSSSLLLFDYITYTVDSSAVPSSATKFPGPLPVASTSTQALPSFPGSSMPSSSSSSAPSSRPPQFVGGLVGGIVGGLVAILLILGSALLLRRYKSRLDWRPRHTGDGPGGESAPHQGGPPEVRVSRAETSSTSSLLSPSPAPRASFLSEDFTAIAPYSDPKFAPTYSPRSSKLAPSTPTRSPIAAPSEARPPSARPPSNTGAADVTFVLDSEYEFAPPSSPSPGPTSAFPFPFARSPGRPPSHSIDVPDPALSVTGTERSLRHAEITREIQELETMVREMHYPGRRGAGADVKTPPPAPQREELSRRERLRELKNEIARLRVQLARERRLVMEAAPRKKRPGKRILAVIE